MSGVRLEVEVHLVTGATTSVRNVVRSVNRAGLQVQDIVLEPLASAEAVLSDEEKELGILLIDLGGGTTDVALFRDGAVWYTGILPLGGDHISNDVAVGLRTPDRRRGGAEEAPRLRADRAGARGRGDRRAVGGRAQGARSSRARSSPRSSSRASRRSSPWSRAISARPGSRTWPRRASWSRAARSIMQGVPELAEQVFDLPVRRGVPAGHRRALRRGAEPDLCHRRGPGALRRARPRSGGGHGVDDGTLRRVATGAAG